MREQRAWQRLVRMVETVVREQPLWKLQTVGKESLISCTGRAGASIPSKSGLELGTVFGSLIP
jgi:hypothetical protein